MHLYEEKRKVSSVRERGGRERGREREGGEERERRGRGEETWSSREAVSGPGESQAVTETVYMIYTHVGGEGEGRGGEGEGREGREGVGGGRHGRESGRGADERERMDLMVAI